MQYNRFAELYDRLMSDVDYDAWANYLLSFIPASSLVLECACGTGEMTLRLAKAGHNVTATDLSEDMLRVASEKLRLSGASGRNVHFAQIDMRSLSAHKPANCVISCCDGVNYLLSREDVKKFFASAHSVLKPGGLLLFDISSRYKLSRVLGDNCFINSEDQTPYMWQNTYDGQSKLIKMELSFFIRKGDLYERFDETHIQRAHSEKEILNWLAECGFSTEAYDCFTRSAAKPDSERIQFVARKER